VAERGAKVAGAMGESEEHQLKCKTCLLDLAPGSNGNDGFMGHIGNGGWN